MKSVFYSVVIPAYNSNRSLDELVKRLHAVFHEDIRETYEIIFVDDCSTRTETWNILQTIALNNPSVRAFRLAKNFGQAGALLCGMAQARGQWIITMDDDLQHRPEDIPLLLEQRDHDVVLARFPEKQCSYWKKLSSDIKSRLDLHLLGKPRHITASPFRLLKRQVVQNILSIHTLNPFHTALILAVTSDLVNVDVTHEARKYGKSNYNLRKSLSLLSNMLFNNSSFMLRAMSMFGFALTGLSILVGVGLAVRRLLQNQPVEGWTSLMVVTLMSAGTIIFCLGVLGEYMARLIATAESRPPWVIKERIDSAGNEP
jgi:glycosyltransferase involved in cell wall biosynthesis